VSRNPDGRLIFQEDRVIVPSTWSQIASDIIAQKYFRKAGVPEGKREEWKRWVPPGEGSLEKTLTMGRSTTPGRCFTVWPTPGWTGAGRTVTSTPRRTSIQSVMKMGMMGRVTEKECNRRGHGGTQRKPKI
jgi:ribonucleoside-diphosphate reductase alpha chain